MRRLIVISLVACGPYYESGSLGSQAHALACLDLVVEASRVAGVSGTVVDWRFGNRCDHAVMVDLTRARATAITIDGDREAAEVFDPNHVLKPLRLDAGGSGHERIAYDAPPVSAAWLELDIGGVDASGPPKRTLVKLAVADGAEVTP